MAKRERNKFNYPPGGRKALRSQDFLQHLLDCDRQNFLLSGAISGGMETERRDGLVEGHAYSILQVLTITAESGEHLALVQFRNPWGNDKEWNGAWSDNWPLWSRYSKIKKVIRPSTEDDAIFWMCWDDVQRIFTEIFVCPKAMREGEAAKMHSETTADWTKFSKSKIPSKPKPPSHSKRPHPMKVGLATQLLKAGLGMVAEGEDEDEDDSTGEPQQRWQVELRHGEWSDYGPEEQQLLQVAAKFGRPSVTFEARGQTYEVRLREGIQRNTHSGKTRNVRAVIERHKKKFNPPARRESKVWKPQIGDNVRIWSESQKKWVVDGNIIAAAPDGSVHVKYNNSASTKWVTPHLFAKLLRPAKE
eukprot:TRINITY_DN95339_c0_g1_i1.p1 TRINITY_DN95339_c0_g1~~TRINITY_DN95339_c0_g1_i1.p1  ORF type:complete len:394 (+),score=78.53 TRINITY_DN95339_c0_g1_i1:102-1184(+)